MIVISICNLITLPSKLYALFECVHKQTIIAPVVDQRREIKTRKEEGAKTAFVTLNARRV